MGSGTDPNVSTSHDAATPVASLPGAAAHSSAVIIGVLLLLWTTAQIHRLTVATYIGATSIMADFGVTATGAGLLAAVYFPAYGLIQVPSGIMADVLRPKRILLAGGSLFALSTVAFAASPTLELAVVARVAVGLTSGLLWLSMLKICATLPDVPYTRAVSFMVSLGSLGSVLTLAGLPAVVTLVEWRVATMLLALPILAATVALALVRVPTSQGASGAGGGPRAGTSADGARLRERIAESGRGLAVVLRSRRYWQIFLPAMMWNGSQFALLSWLPRYARDVLGLPPAAVGLVPAVMPIGLIIGSWSLGWWLARRPGLGMRPFYVNAAGWAVLMAILASGVAAPFGAAALFALLLGMGLLYGAWFMGLARTGHMTEARFLGTATGVINGLGFFPAFVLPWLMGAAMDAIDRPTSSTWSYSAAAFQAGFLIVFVGFVGGLIGAALLYRAGRQR